VIVQSTDWSQSYICVVETEAGVSNVGFLVISVNFDAIKSGIAFCCGSLVRGKRDVSLPYIN